MKPVISKEGSEEGLAVADQAVDQAEEELCTEARRVEGQVGEVEADRLSSVAGGEDLTSTVHI